MFANLFFVILALSLCICILSDANNDDQYDFLTELYDLTSGDMWVNSSNWLKRDDNVSICDWHGITCAGKWVQKLNLPKNGLGGPLPNAWERLPYLDTIDLSSNKCVFCLF